MLGHFNINSDVIVYMYYYTYCFNLRPVIFKEIIFQSMEVLFIARNKSLECVMRERRTAFSSR